MPPQCRPRAGGVASVQTVPMRTLVVVLGERASGRVGNAQELLLEQAKVYEEQLGRNDKAIEVLSALRQQDMESVVVSRELERILSKESRWADLVQFYDPTDLFGDLADAIAELHPHVAPELEDDATGTDDES